MTKQRALRLAREWAQGHKCTLRDGEAAEYHSMFAAMLEESIPNEPLTCDGCDMQGKKITPCASCIRDPRVCDYYDRRPPEGES